MVSITPPWSYVSTHAAEKVIRVRENDERGNGLEWGRMGALNRSIEGGLRHASVEGAAVMVKDSEDIL